MTRPEAMKLGPFVGGLNLLSDPQNIDNAELAECINFEVDLDGSLMSRPAIVETINNSSSGGTRNKVIGRASFSAGGDYLIVCNGSAVYAFNGSTYTHIVTTVSECAVQYNDNVYIVATQASAANGGRWDGTTYTSDANIPRGQSALFHKSRMFVVPGINTTTTPSRLTFSDTITAVVFTWNAANIIDVAPGDGDNLVDLIVYNDNLLLFKENSIYLLAYDIAPADAVLRKIHGNIGVNFPNCVDYYDNSIFFLHEGKVWEMMNYEFKQVNQKAPFVLDTFIDSEGASIIDKVWLRRLGNRILVGFYRKRYSFSLNTRTWSEWQTTNHRAQYFGPPVELIKSLTTNESPKYYMATTTQSYLNFYYVTEDYVAGTRDYFFDNATGTTNPAFYSIVCTFRSKNYDFDVPFVFKRMMWWGMHANSGAEVQGQVIINNLNQTNDLWENVGLFLWGDLEGTWGSVLNEFTVPDDVVTTAEGGAKFYKFLKSLRFRTVAFRVTIENDGTTIGGPCRLFTLSAIVGYKQVVSKDAN